MTGAGANLSDPKLSPAGRLDEYIKTFEARYGAVPIESPEAPEGFEGPPLKDSLASISSISLEASGHRDAFTTAWTPRFPEPITSVALSSGYFKPDFKFDHFQPKSGTGIVTGITGVTTSLDGMGTTYATGLLSEHGDDMYHFKSSPPDISPLRVPTSTAWPRKPCAKPERGRASSNPPDLKLLGPRPRRQSFQPLHAPRGPMHLRGIGPIGAMKAMRPAMVASSTSDRSDRWPISGLPSNDMDEVNCQSPVHIPQPSKLLRSVSGAAVQTEEAEVAAARISSEVAVQTDGWEPLPPDSPDFKCLQVEVLSSPLGFPSKTSSTPDFGAKERWESLRVRSQVQSQPSSTQTGNLSKFVASDGVLKQRLQNALTRGLHHLMNLQTMTAQ